MELAMYNFNYLKIKSAVTSLSMVYCFSRTLINDIQMHKLAIYLSREDPNLRYRAQEFLDFKLKVALQTFKLSNKGTLCLW